MWITVASCKEHKLITTNQSTSKVAAKKSQPTLALFSTPPDKDDNNAYPHKRIYGSAESLGVAMFSLLARE